LSCRSSVLTLPKKTRHDAELSFFQQLANFSNPF
jgi:hypothetical protein